MPYRQDVAFLHEAKALGVQVDTEAVVSSEHPFPLRILRHLLALGCDRAATRTIRSNRKADHLLDRFRTGYDELFYLFRTAVEQDQLESLYSFAGDESLRPLWRLLPIERPWIGSGMHEIVVDGQGSLFLCDRLVGSESRAVGTVSRDVDWKAAELDPLVVERVPCSHCWARFACGSACRLNGIDKNYPSESLDRIACQLNEYLVEQNLRLIAQTAFRHRTLEPLITALATGGYPGHSAALTPSYRTA